MLDAAHWLPNFVRINFLTNTVVPWLESDDAKSFCSLQYLAFFGSVFVLYWLMPWKRARVYLLVAASFAFYACWNKQLALLISATTVLDYLIARGLEALAAGRWRRVLLGISLSVNLGLLAYFKYVNFFLDSLGQTLNSVGMSRSLPVLEVIVPFGISFYTFEAINYTIDVYRRRVPAERNLANFMLFILFFPHLIAGPIVRSRDFLPQIQRTKRWDWPRFQLGVQFFLMGLFKKMAIADHMDEFVRPVFAGPQYYGSWAVWVAVLAFAVQIYCDFSGYTDMAIGSAHMLGYKLTRNFNMPYLAVNISEFWHRWHISLSSWLRDYLFIPLGGSRGSKWRTTFNLLITMTLGGLWHGASWTFIVWGALHGLLLIGHRAFRDFCKPRPRLDAALQSPPGTAFRILATFLCVCIGWVFFRATTFTGAAAILRRMLIVHHGLTTPLPNRSLWVLGTVLVVGHVVGATGLWKRWAPRVPGPILGIGYALVLTVALLLAPDTGKAFIYFQF
jgi:alginate O-acetyltransferase complex protein AlgI